MCGRVIQASPRDQLRLKIVHALDPRDSRVPGDPFRNVPPRYRQRAADLSLDVGRVLGASRRDVSLDDARLEAREVGFAQISAVGGGLPGAATEIGLDAVEEGHELSMVAHR